MLQVVTMVTWQHFFLNLENISMFHSITSSLLHFPLDIWKPGELPYEKARDARWKI